MQIIKIEVKTDHIPIILLTAKATKEEIIEGLETKADDYLTKPFDADELKIKIQNLIEIRAELQKKYFRNDVIELSKVEVTSIENSFMKNAIKIVEKNLENEKFSVEDLTSEMMMSRVQFHRKIKAVTNHSTTHFIRSIRLQKAVELLKNGAGNITEVAYMVGFNSQPYFSSSFTERFGKSPSEFSKE